MPKQLKRGDLKRIDEAVQYFVANRHLFDGFALALMNYFQGSPKLSGYIHFIKYRLKEHEHLRKKLIRKAEQGEVIDKDNLFAKINDLAGIRIIHLHTTQVPAIHAAILSILQEQQLKLVEKPRANCWDVEYDGVYKEFGIATRSRSSMYTTVHYVIRANQRAKVSCEVQVRTLMDEVWGEVSHRINYPDESPIQSCQSQLKVLARLTTGCTRLVDSIFEAHNAEIARKLSKLPRPTPLLRRGRAVSE
jgi:ppGpp synthetase/RelA/SpoT-type nucleotidyltranferase